MRDLPEFHSCTKAYHKSIVTSEQPRAYVSDMSSRVHALNERTRAKAARMKELKNRIRLAEDFARLKPIVDAIPPKGGWGKKHKKYVAEHDSEIRQFLRYAES